MTVGAFARVGGHVVARPAQRYSSEKRCAPMVAWSESLAADAAQAALKTAVERLFADAEAELVGLSDGSRKAKPLRRLLKHREGLCVFVDKPCVPMDNNVAERGLRCAVIRRRLSFGSNSEDGAKFTAIMHSVVGTLSMHGIDVLRWLEAWLTACANNGARLHFLTSSRLRTRSRPHVPRHGAIAPARRPGSRAPACGFPPSPAGRGIRRHRSGRRPGCRGPGRRTRRRRC